MLLNNLNRDMFQPVRSHTLVACLGTSTGFEGDSFRETHLWEHFGRTDNIALMTCLKKLKCIRRFSEFSTLIFGHSAGSTKLDRPHSKEFWFFLVDENLLLEVQCWQHGFYYDVISQHLSCETKTTKTPPFCANMFADFELKSRRFLAKFSQISHFCRGNFETVPWNRRPRSRRFYRTPKKRFYRTPEGSMEPPFGPWKASI